MPKNPAKPGGNPYKVLYWMGAGVLLLFLGILALVVLRAKPGPYVAVDPERTLLWMYDATNPGGSANAAIIEESRSRGRLSAVAFTPPAAASKLFTPGQSGRQLQDFVAAQVERRVHHRAFMPYSVVATLVDAAGSISVDGKSMKGAEAIAYIRDGGQNSAVRAATVMLALSQAVSRNGVSMGVSEGLSLARQVDTDMDLTALPDVLGRWSGYDRPAVQALPGGELAGLAGLLLPDPAAPAPKQ